VKFDVPFEDPVAGISLAFLTIPSDFIELTEAWPAAGSAGAVRFLPELKIWRSRPRAPLTCWASTRPTNCRACTGPQTAASDGVGAAHLPGASSFESPEA